VRYATRKSSDTGSQFVKDYVRPFLVKHGVISNDYLGRCGLRFSPQPDHRYDWGEAGRPKNRSVSAPATPTAKSPWTYTHMPLMT